MGVNSMTYGKLSGIPLNILVVYYTLKAANNKGADQTVQMRRVVCTIVVGMQQS